MNVFLLGIRITDKAILEDGKANVIAEALPSSNKRVSTKVQLIQKADHYVGKLLQDLEEKLCGKSRPGHFRGVCTVVLKLFNIVQPEMAFFGQKDAQQVIILKKMVQDLNCPVNILALPIVREEDGLAMSSRNMYLNPEQRQSALCLHQSLQEARRMINSGELRAAPILGRMKEIILAEPETRIDYLAIVDTVSLEPMEEISNDCLIALAAFVGKVRLIDNMMIRNLSAFRIDEE